MCPLITQNKPCPECMKDAQLNNWHPPDGYDPQMRKYCCPSCGNEFYLIGGELSAHMVATDLQNSEPGIER